MTKEELARQLAMQAGVAPGTTVNVTIEGEEVTVLV